MKEVVFTFIAESKMKDEVEAKEKVKQLIEKLQEKCKENNLVLREGKLFASGVLCYFPDCLQARYQLAIEKRKGITYNEIYGIVNSIQVVPFKITNGIREVDIYV